MPQDMQSIIKNIEDGTVYSIVIKNHGIRYLTLYYRTSHSDAVLHSGKKIVCFPSKEVMRDFCNSHGLKIYGDIYEYDFDASLDNPLDYNRVLGMWNLLNTIADGFGMYFEGNLRKYTPLYDLLFCLNTSDVPIPDTYTVSEKHLKYILKVFRKKDHLLGRFELCEEE